MRSYLLPVFTLFSENCTYTTSRWSRIHHQDRLKLPLILRDGQLEPASWDEAMSLIVQKAKEVSEKLTRHGIGLYTSGRLFLEEYYVLAMIDKAGLNTLHMYVSCRSRETTWFRPGD